MHTTGASEPVTMALLREIIAERPDFDLAHTYLADYLKAAGRKEEALAVLDRGGEITELRSRGGFLGRIGSISFEEGELFLAPGDRIMMYTDGIIESPGDDEEEFGERRLVETLGRHRSRDLRDMVRLVIEEVGAWGRGRPQHDDVTLVLGRVT